MSRLDHLIAQLCPGGVRFSPLGDITKRITDGSHNPPPASDADPSFPMISAKNITRGRVDFNDARMLSREDYETENKRTAVALGDVLLTIVGAIGRVALVSTDEPMVFQRSVCVIKLDRSVMLPGFLRYMLESSPMQRRISAEANGAAQKGLYLRQVAELVVAVPPVDVQAEITRVLDSFTRLEAELEAELEARRRQYEYYRDELLTFADDAPRWVKLDQVATFKYGYTATASLEGDYRFIRITDITDGGKLSAVEPRYVDRGDDADGYLVRAGDVLMARTGATFGKTVLVTDPPPAVYASFLIRIALDPREVLPGYYWHFAQSDMYWQQAHRLVGKGGQPQFNANAVKEIRFPVPPLEEQARIVSALDKFDALVSDLSTGLPAELNARRKQYEYYGDRLLTFKEAA